MPPELPLHVEAGHEAVFQLPTGTHHELQGVTVALKPQLRSREAHGMYGGWRASVGRVMNMNPYEVKLQLQDWLSDLVVAEEAPYLWREYPGAEVPMVWSHTVETTAIGKGSDPESGSRRIKLYGQARVHGPCS